MGLRKEISIAEDTRHRLVESLSPVRKGGSPCDSGSSTRTQGSMRIEHEKEHDWALWVTVVQARGISSQKRGSGYPIIDLS